MGWYVDALSRACNQQRQTSPFTCFTSHIFNHSTSTSHVTPCDCCWCYCSTSEFTLKQCLLATFHHFCAVATSETIQHHLPSYCYCRNGSPPVHATLYARQSTKPKLGSHRAREGSSSTTTAHSTTDPTTSQPETPRPPTALTREGRPNLGSHTRSLQTTPTHRRLRSTHQQERKGHLKNPHHEQTTPPALLHNKHFQRTHPSPPHQHRRPPSEHRPFPARGDQELAPIVPRRLAER